MKMAQGCEEKKRRVEEEIVTPLEEKVEETIEKCKKKKCKWWCLCCNKWFCWIETLIYWVIKWIVIILVKWVGYIICRLINVIFTILLTVLNILAWPVKWLWCMWGRGEIDKLPLRKLQIEVIIVDFDEKTRNPVKPEAIDTRIGYADRILRAEARIAVNRKGEIQRMYSDSLYRIDASSLGARVSEFLKGILLLLGRNSARNLTVYIVGSIQGAEGLHLPLYGSVFIEGDTPDTSLCHEIGHALLSIFNTYHSKTRGYLMYTPPDERERDANWPKDVPKLSPNERCTMRRSRWLDWSWVPFLP
jgi:hypothetical protein